MSRLSSRLLTWYHKNKRTLPWRDHPDPYAVWVSEIMLQQTRVETVIPYFKRWMSVFPTIKKLAMASEQEVLNIWEGLGYYSRARNLHKAAKIVIDKHHGKLPHDVDDLRALPGIGRYTVGAIASMAFGMDEPSLDGNLRRVYSRLFDVTEPADSSGGEIILWELAAKYLPNGQAGDYNQALMDLGAMICVPRNPHCLICPLMRICKARQAGTQEERPVLKPKKRPPHFFQVAAVIVKGDRLLLAKRPSRGLLGGMWEFPNGRVVSKTGVEISPAKEVERVLSNSYPFKLRSKEALSIVQHTYTHFSVTVYPFICILVTDSKIKGLRWVRIEELDKFPMGRIDRQIARQVQSMGLNN
jgi:A/G-specific adenine glycosylase